MQAANRRKARGAEKILPKLLKIAVNMIDSHIGNILNHDLLNKRFPEKVKIANVCSIYKKEASEELKSYRPFSILVALSKIY